MLKKWQIKEEISKEFREKFSEIDPIILQLLYNRGIKDKDGIDKFLNPCYSSNLYNPFLFRDMDKAVKRIFKAIDKGEKITIYGDYDSDGVTSVVLLEKTLREIGELVLSIKYQVLSDEEISDEGIIVELGTTQKLKIENCKLKINEVGIYIPHRGKEGYGLNKKALKYIKENGSSLIITVDCGVSNFEEVEYANSLGLDVIITDHHQPHEKLPPAYAVLNPKVANDNYPFRGLAGVGVAFKLAQGLLASSKLKVESSKLESFEKWLLDLVVVGTIADCCPLIDENRIFAKYGLIVLNKTKNVGFSSLIEIGIAKNSNNRLRCGNIESSKLLSMEIDTWNVAFQIAPRINAAGRLGHANTAYELLSTNNEEKAWEIATALDETNKERQSLTDKAVREAIDMIEKEQKNKAVFFVYEKNWEPGILGLIAGKICERYYKPVFAFTKKEDELVASGRSIPEFNMIEALREMEKVGQRFQKGENPTPTPCLRRRVPLKGREEKAYLKKYGGHAQACGLSLDNEESLDKFREDFLKISECKLKGADLFPKVDIDIELEIKDVNWEVVDKIKILEPFGEGNSKPLIKFNNVEVLEVKIMGNDGKHLKLKLGDTRITNYELRIKNGEQGTEGRDQSFISQTIDAVGFSMNDENRLWGEKLKIGDSIEIVGYLDVNEWNGNREIQIKMVDMKLITQQV